MHTLAFDGRMGAAGDMLLGALVAAGADPDALAPVEAALDVSYEVTQVDRCGIDATRVTVRLDGDAGGASESGSEAAKTGDHHGHTRESAAGDHARDGDTGDHTHGDEGGHTHGGAGDHTHAEGQGPHRRYAEVVDIIGEMALPNAVERDATAIVDRLGRAEPAVHGTDLADTYFPEVGADDAIADIVGTCLLLADLDVDRVVTTPLSAGGGTVEMAHGTYPVPTPAVVEIAEDADWSLAGGPVDEELLTPTGAAILAHLAQGVERLPGIRVEASGYGAGGRDVPDRPNVLRAVLGAGGERLRRDDIAVLETNVDDVAPEILGDLHRSLGEVGARDVTVLPATMKKSRPGHLVKVVCKPADVKAVAARLAEETGTLGIREHGAGHRWVADRTLETVSVVVDGDAYEVGVKVASTADGAVFDRSAEYDDAAAVAEATGLPVKEIMQRAERSLDG